jgi:hypothetical protein
MNARVFSSAIFCMVMLFGSGLLHGQETADTRAIRALFDADQDAWKQGDGRTVLANRHQDYFTVGVDRNNGKPDFHGVTVGDWSEEKRQSFLDPDFMKGFAAAVADTAIDVEHRSELVRIDVNDAHAVAISRIEWARNDTTRNVRIRSGWESLWILRKIGGDWQFVNAVSGISSWSEERPR